MRFSALQGEVADLRRNPVRVGLAYFGYIWDIDMLAGWSGNATLAQEDFSGEE